MADDKYIILLDKMSEVAIQTGVIIQRCDSIERELTQIHEEDRRTNQLMDEHILGVKTNAERLNVEKELRQDAIKKLEDEKDSLDLRLEQLEKYPQFIKSLKTVAIYVTAIGGAVIMVTKFLGMW